MRKHRFSSDQVIIELIVVHDKVQGFFDFDFQKKGKGFLDEFLTDMVFEMLKDDVLKVLTECLMERMNV